MPQVLESFDTGLLILPDLNEYDEESAGLDRTLAAAPTTACPCMWRWTATLLPWAAVR